MDTKAVILFDGECNFCCGAADFVLKRDTKGRFRFAALQSAAGLRLRDSFSIPQRIDSIILVEGNSAWMRSTAALRIARELGPPWSLLWALMAVPRPLRDFAYDRFAERRKAWFGRRKACRVPGPGEKERFLER